MALTTHKLPRRTGRKDELSRKMLFSMAKQVCRVFLDLNDIELPTVHVSKVQLREQSMAWHDDGIITIHLPSCYGVKDWRTRGWPGYRVDETPYGVFCHEIGHYIDYVFDYKPSASKKWHLLAMRSDVRMNRHDDPKDGPGEVFAESMMLFITNPGLLLAAMPERYRYFTKELKLRPILDHDYIENLRHLRAPKPIIRQAVRFAKKKVYLPKGMKEAW